jgi:hypothetical protein
MFRTPRKRAAPRRRCPGGSRCPRAGLAGKFQVGREVGMHAVQRLAADHGIAQLAQQVHARALHLGRAGQAGDAGDLLVVDARHHTVSGGADLKMQRAQTRVVVVKRLAALGGDDGLHARQGAAGVEDVARDGVAVAAAHVGVAFDQAARQAQGLLAQVVGRARVVFQHAHHVARLQHRANAVADGLAPVGDDHVQRQAQAPRHIFKQAAQALRLRHGAHLGRGADGNVEHQVGGAGGDLLRQDGRHHLPRRVDGQRALDRDQHVVGGRELGRAAPGQAAAVVAHDALQLLQRQLDVGQHLHGVGRARRRGDGTRRGLGAQHAVRRHDGHDQHGGAVARDAADAVLVHHQGSCQSSRWPLATMASERKNTSSRSSSSRLQATTKAVSSILE